MVRQILTCILVTCFAVMLSARELCRAQLDCPIDFDADTAIVGYNTVMLSEVFEHCSPDSVVEGIIDTIADTISLFIIIDHSSSMKFMDPSNNRYKVVNELIDSIYHYSPASEIGIVAFSNKLMHNYNTDPYFNAVDNCLAQGWNDAYVPLTRLDSQVGGVSAVEKLKWSIEISDTAIDQNGCKKLVQADYGTSGRKGYTGGTDISLCFEAAREAMKTALYAPKRQYILFLSDGEHQFLDPEREPYARDYIKGDSVPTTFTAFFVNQGQPIPDQIDTMTWNIQKNGYSTNNIYSEIWGTQSEVSTIFSKILNNIIGDGLKHFTSKPVSLTMNGITTTTFDDTFAYFDAPFCALSSTGTLQLDISYTWHWNAPLNKDVTRTYKAFVKQGSQPDAISVECWNQGRIFFYYGGAPITFARPDQLLLEVRFFPPDSGSFPPLGPTVGLELGSKGTADKLNLILSQDPTKTYYYSSFLRAYSVTAVLTDAILQNTDIDSIIATYRNASIPLDTLRASIGVLPQVDLSVTGIHYLDQDADGHPDAVRVRQAGGQVLSFNDCQLIKPYSSITSPRNVGAPVGLTPATHGFDITITDGSALTPGKTDLYYDSLHAVAEWLYINSGTVMLSSGYMFPFVNTQISDSMAPVINSGVYYDFPDTSRFDTLKVALSEMTGMIVHINPFLFKRIPGVGEFTLNASYVRTDNNIAVFSVIPTSGQITPRLNDSIWINYAAMIADKNNITQNNPNNIKRLLNYYKVFSLLSVVYLDTSSHPDGFIDMIHVTTDVVPDTGMLNSLLANNSITLPDYQNFTITGIVQTDSGFAIMVTTSNTTPITSVDPLKDSLWVSTTSSTTNGIIFNSQLPIQDKVAPVIIKAVLCPKFVTNTNVMVFDTLIVTFSEPVISPPYFTDKPFLFMYVVGGKPYTMVLQFLGTESGGQIQTFLVLSSEKAYPENGDPVWINPIAGIKDLAGNVQNNPNNKPVPLIVKPFHFVTQILISTNPVITFDNTISINGITVQGVGIQVKILGGWPDYVTMTGEIYIFDAVGNKINRHYGTPTADQTSIIFFWDGLNTYDRKVWDGTYLAYVSIRSSQGVKIKIKTMIGVNRYGKTHPIWE